jgi:hypothetical protein
MALSFPLLMARRLVGAVLHLVGTRHAEAAKLIRYQIAKASSSNATASRRVTGSSTANSEFVVSAPQVLHERMPRQKYLSAAVLLEPAHRSHPRLETAVVGLDAVVGGQLGAMSGPGTSSPSTAGYAAAWSVTTCTGIIAVVPMARSKKQRARGV